MANPVMNRASDSTGLNLLSMLQSSPPAAGMNGGFSGALEQSVRDQQSRVRQASDMRQEPPQRLDQPRQQQSPERLPERTRSDSAVSGRTERPTQAPGRSETSSETSSEASAQTDPSKPASGQTGTSESDQASASGNETVSHDNPQTAGESGIDAEEQAAITAAPANLAVLATIIAALDKGGPGQRLQSVGEAGLAESLAGGGLQKSLGNALSDLLGRQGDGDAELSDEAPAFQAAKQLKGDILATQASIAKFSTQLAQTITSQGSAAQPGAYGMTPAAALGATEGPTSLTPSQPGMIPGLRSEAASQLPQLQVTTPAGQRAWAEDVGNKMLWMVGRGESRAELVLTPPSLGKLGVSIQVSGDQTTAQFVTSTAAARDALEQAMPRLRELLQQAGINLGQADVSTSSERHTPGDERSSSRSGSGFGHDGGAAIETELPGLSQGGNWTRTGLGVIDTFA